jgi:thymidine kinase
MFAGKTSHLMNIVDLFTNHNNKIKVLIVNHASDGRVKGDFIATHDKKKMKAVKRKKLMPLMRTKSFKESDIVLIDETQFFDDVVQFVKKTERMPKRFYFAGLKGDINRKPFENISNLIPLMDVIKDISAIDFSSSEMKSAPFTKRKDQQNTSKIQIGGAEMYESVSRASYLKNKK